MSSGQDITALLLNADGPGQHETLHFTWDEAVRRTAVVLAEVANYGEGCKAAEEQGKVPCAEICECKAEADTIVDAIFEPEAP